MPWHGKDGLWMELNAFDRKLSMADAHYLVVIGRLGGHLEAFRKALSICDKRMISRSLERTLDTTEDSFSIVSNRAGLTVAQFPCSDYLAAKRMNNPLVSQTDAQCRDLPAHFLEDSRAHSKVSRITGSARARRDYD